MPRFIHSSQEALQSQPEPSPYILGPMAVRAFLQPRPKASPDTYYDITTGHIVVGKEGMSHHLGADGKYEYLRSLPDLITDTELEPDGYRFHPLEYTKWERSDFTNYGRWINALLKTSSRRNVLKRTNLIKANMLGLGPGIGSIVSEFGSLAAYYGELRLPKTNKRSLFDGMSIEDFVSHIRRIATDVKKKPTEKILWNRIKKGRIEPSPRVIERRVGSLSKLLELAGYPNIKSWKSADYIDWGIKFMLSNEGRLPSARQMTKLCKLYRGPGRSAVERHFGSIKVYQGLLEPAFFSRQQQIEVERLEKLERIKSAIANQEVPKELFGDVKGSDVSEQETIVRYARYVVADHLLGDNFSVSKLSIATMNNLTVRKIGFVRAIAKTNDAITAGDIESAALYLGVFNDIWPIDDYLKDLRIEN